MRRVLIIMGANRCVSHSLSGEYERIVMDCIHCGQPVLQARWEAGYHYCFNPICAHELRSRQEQYRLVLLPKQGFTYVEADSPHLLDGKSSGRQ
jgi:hypothetical protein